MLELGLDELRVMLGEYNNGIQKMNMLSKKLENLDMLSLDYDDDLIIETSNEKCVIDKDLKRECVNAIRNIYKTRLEQLEDYYSSKKVILEKCNDIVKNDKSNMLQ